MMSVSGSIALAVSILAVLVSLLALWTSWIGAQRGARTQLTELVSRLTKQLRAFEKIPEKDERRYPATEDLEVLVRQADSLIQGLWRRVPDSDCMVVARVLETVGDSWRGDHYWKLAVQNAGDEYYRARNRMQWANYLFIRGDRDAGAAKMHEAVDGLRLQTVDAWVVRGEIYRSWAGWDADRAVELRHKARDEYRRISDRDTRRKWYLRDLDDEQAKAKKPPDSQNQAAITPLD
jgi:hypothetical protein